MEIASWPASVIGALAYYLSKEPAPIERIEIGIAQLAAIYINSKKEKTKAPAKVKDLMPYTSAWDEEEVMTADSLVKAFGAKTRKR